VPTLTFPQSDLISSKANHRVHNTLRNIPAYRYVFVYLYCTNRPHTSLPPPRIAKLQAVISSVRSEETQHWFCPIDVLAFQLNGLPNANYCANVDKIFRYNFPSKEWLVASTSPASMSRYISGSGHSDLVPGVGLTTIIYK
jgi:hypothetical protein